MSGIEIREILFGSLDHQAEIELRYKVLREPLGLAFTDEELLAERSDFHIGLFEQRKLAACLILKTVERNQIKMRQVAVDPSRQGAGLGRQLVVFAEDFAKNKGFAAIVLNARESALSFYEKLEYEIVSEPINEIGIPHRKMFKKL